MKLGRNPIIKDNISPARKIAISGLVIAIYIVLVYITQNFAFGQYQIRIATSLYSLSAIYPFLIVPMGISNMLSNILGGLGALDIVGGLIVGIVTPTSVYLVKRFNLSDIFIALPIILGPGLIVPIWLSVITHVPYNVLALSLCIGQIIPGIAGIILVKHLRNKI